LPFPVPWTTDVSKLLKFLSYFDFDLIHTTDHWQDVIAGAILGLAVAYFAYRQYFPSLASPMSHKPYSPRIRREEGELPTVNPVADRTMSYNDGMDREDVELVGGSLHKPDPILMDREGGEFRVNTDETRA
jgi:diacylglycerol diphosphate phosphatase/phosphatidate phosphatase